MASRKVLVAAGALAALTYAGLWLALIAKWTWLEAVDTRMLRQFHDFGSYRPGWIAFWQVVSDVLSPSTLRVAALAGIVAAVIRRNTRVAVFLVCTIFASGLVTATAKALSDRPRPGTALTGASSTAFPSGHALAMTVGVLTAITLLWSVLRPSLRIPAVIVGAGLVLLVGVARVALNVHHPSDVLAGWALGLLYYLVCLTVVRPLQPNDASRLHHSDLASPD